MDTVKVLGFRIEDSILIADLVSLRNVAREPHCWTNPDVSTLPHSPGGDYPGLCGSIFLSVLNFAAFIQLFLD